MPEEGKTYFWIGMEDADMLIVLTLAKNLGIKKEELIMRALRTEIQRIQEEWRMSKKVAAQSLDDVERSSREAKREGEA